MMPALKLLEADIIHCANVSTKIPSCFIPREVTLKLLNILNACGGTCLTLSCRNVSENHDLRCATPQT